MSSIASCERVPFKRVEGLEIQTATPGRMRQLAAFAVQWSAIRRKLDA